MMGMFCGVGSFFLFVVCENMSMVSMQDERGRLTKNECIRTVPTGSV